MKPEIRVELTNANIGTADVLKQGHTLEVRNLSAFYGATKALENVNITFKPNVITAMQSLGARGATGAGDA